MRSKLLTHWTGNDITVDPQKLDNESRNKYLERLLSVLKEGFWLMPSVERLQSEFKGFAPMSLQYEAHMTCFTELKLSGSRPHFSKYGLLGIVVDRGFVLERSGGPVHYVRSGQNDGVVANSVMLLKWLQEQVAAGRDGAKTIMENAQLTCGFLKAMSRGSDDFSLLEEQEWRICQSQFQVEAQRIVATKPGHKAKYLVPLTRDDVKMIIVPDDEVLSLVASSKPFQNWAGRIPPTLLTTRQVEEF